jgi:quinoprotein glucose dehydrogenase
VLAHSVPVGRTAARFRRAAPVGLLLLLAVCRPAPPPEGPPPDLSRLPGVTRIAAEEAERRAAEIRAGVSVELAPDLALDLWAAEPLLIDPIALDVDPRGHVFVTGTTRTRGYLDIRNHPDWLIEALSLRSVDDYRRFVRRRMSPERSEQNTWLRDLNQDGIRDWRDLEVEKERVYRLADTDGDGRADLSQLVIEDFHTEVTDVAGALRVHQGDLYMGVAPDVWRLRDSTGRGAFDIKELISHGYGTHPGFGGHGVSGITVGPDGRIYWAVGDMGLHVTDREGRTWSYPDQGAILRAEPDGSGFEVFAAGLRNTHEFAFDELGNLITVDNDGDHRGETERLVYLVDGSDSGWRVGWQFGKYTDPANNPYNVWMDEGLFRPRFEGQAAYILPPLSAYHTGPAGLTYNPGTALDERWRNHFFVSEFTGSPGSARIHAFRVRPSGAGFALDRDTVVMRGVLVTGMQFGPDGALYLADWVEGWSAQGNGRIWKLDAPGAAASPLRAETRALLAASFARRTPAELSRLLSHPDMRVRKKAQFALAERGAARPLLAAARGGEGLARVHGLWGLAQLARRDARHADALQPFLRDANPEIRAQAARLLGDLRHAPAAAALLPLLRDAEPRPRFFAAEALGRIGYGAAVQPLVRMLDENDDADVYLRHAGSLALARIGDVEATTALAAHPSRAVRLAATVALRRMKHPGVAVFLLDADEHVVTEAARAINDDGGIEAALPALARVLEQPRFASEPLVRRAINANQRLGTLEAARRLAAYAARDHAPEPLRVEAVAALGVLPRPSVLDRVDGIHHGAAERDPAIARAALAGLVESHLASGSPALRVALARAAGQVRLTDASAALLGRVRIDPEPEVRVAALQALNAMGDGSLEAAVRTALAGADPADRMAALALIPSLGLPPAPTAELLASVIGRTSMAEQQSAIGALGELRTPEANRVLGGLLEQWARGRLAPEVLLETAEAVQASGDEALAARLAVLRRSQAGAPPRATFAEALRGGSVARGRQVVFGNPSAQCTRCHTFGGAGPDVGPDLRGVGARLTREQLLEALVAPNARVAPGYGFVTLTLHGGETIAGQLLEESASNLLVQTGAGPRRVEAARITRRTNVSAMPSMADVLTRRELRDVVEYMTTLRQPAPRAGGGQR